MTAPNPQPPDRQQIAAHEQAMEAFETAAVALLAGGVAAAVASLVVWVPTEYARLFGPGREAQTGLRFQSFTRQVQSRLRQVHPPRAREVLGKVSDARSLGVRQGLAEAGVPDAAVAVLLDQAPNAAVQEAVDAAIQHVEEKVRQAQVLTGHIDSGTLSDVQAAVAPAQHASTSLERDLISLLHASLNDGLSAAIDHLAGRKLWIAERDACTTCLALSGQLADDNGHFDWTLTFGVKAYPVKAYNDAGQLVEIDLSRPPRHPRCRCRITWWYGDLEPGPHDFPTALRREAERSILNGYALPTEPTSTRIHAAERLLGLVGTSSRSPSGWAVPASVRQRASDALRKGRFTTRPVPNGR